MGYDMTIVQDRDQDEQDAIAAARVRLRSLVYPGKLPEGPERDTAEKEWQDAYDAYDKADRSYFRLNICGMSTCCDVMGQLGMLSPESAPEFPDIEEFGLTDWPENPKYYEGDERAAMEAKLTDGERNYLAACQAVIDYEPQPVRGIPVGKFSSNDGWLVTPAQCEAALATWHAAPEARRTAVEADRAWWGSWIAYLTYAKDRGGFHVN